MTATDNLIEQHGDECTLSQRSDGSVDGYGDPAETWSTAATEKVWIQHPTKLTKAIIASLAGELDLSSYVGFFLSTSVVAKGMILTQNSTRFTIGEIHTLKFLGNTQYKYAALQLAEDT